MVHALSTRPQIPSAFEFRSPRRRRTTPGAPLASTFRTALRTTHTLDPRPIPTTCEGVDPRQDSPRANYKERPRASTGSEISMSAQFVHTCAVASQSRRHPRTYLPGARVAGSASVSMMETGDTPG